MALKTIMSAIKHWYLLFIVGLLFILLGIWVLFTPLESYLALATMFSLSFLIAGIFEILFAFSNRDELDGWGWTLTMGIINLLVGLLLITHPSISITTLPFFVGFTVLFRSVHAISFAFDLKSYQDSDWGNLLIIGVLGIIFSFILIWNPVFAGLSLVVWTGLAFIVTGASAVFFSLRLRRIKTLPKTISKKLRERYEEVMQEVEKAFEKTSS